jgi:serine/threonine-protein kinase
MASDPLVGKVLADRFEIVARIGEGGTGVVYRAKQLTVDREIAIKVLGAHVSTDPQWVKRFHNEARAAAKLDHPNTVRLIDFGQTKEGLLFIAMELLHGRSLRDELDRLGRLPANRALSITIQACGSVGEAHAQGIIHRDIKPDNLFLCEIGGTADFVKVLDFSVAKLDDPNSQQTRAGVVFGTPSYMSPEQGRGGQLGPGSDIYAFGIVMYEMLSGKPPFDSKIPTEVVMMHLRDKPPPLAGVPEPIVRIVSKALDKEPTRRQRSCEQLAQECMGALQELFPGMMSTTGPQAVLSPGRGSAGAGAASARGGGGGRQAPNRTMALDDSAGSAQGGRGGGGGAGYGAPSQGRAAHSASPENKTMFQNAPSPAANPHGTMMLPDSAGVVAFAAAQAQAARNQAAQAYATPEPAKPAGVLFWTAWVVLGVGIGLAAHFIQIHEQLQAAQVAAGKT